MLSNGRLPAKGKPAFLQWSVTESSLAPGQAPCPEEVSWQTQNKLCGVGCFLSCGLVSFVIFILLVFFSCYCLRGGRGEVEWVMGGEDLGGVRGGAKHDKIYCMKNII